MRHAGNSSSWIGSKWHVGENRAAVNQVHFDEEEEHEVSTDDFECRQREGKEKQVALDCRYY
jgi:hypothetical protein